MRYVLPICCPEVGTPAGDSGEPRIPLGFMTLNCLQSMRWQFATGMAGCHYRKCHFSWDFASLSPMSFGQCPLPFGSEYEWTVGQLAQAEESPNVSRRGDRHNVSPGQSPLGNTGG